MNPITLESEPLADGKPGPIIQVGAVPGAAHLRLGEQTVLLSSETAEMLAEALERAAHVARGYPREPWQKSFTAP